MHIGIVSHVSTEQLKDFLDLKGGEPAGTDGATAPNLLIIELIKRGHKITVFSLTDKLKEGAVAEVKGENLTIYYGAYSDSIRKRALTLFKRERKFLTAKIKEIKPDVLHAHWQYEYSWGALSSGLPTIVTCRDSPVKVFLLYKNVYRFVRMIMAYKVLKQATIITATSSYLAVELKKFGVNKHIHVIPNFEPDWLFEIQPKAKKLTAPKICLINNGFDNRKNVGMAIRAFQLFRKSCPGAELHLFGNSYEDGGEANKWAVENDLNVNVLYRGYYPFSSMMDELSGFTLLLHPSKEETFGNTLVESMALGVPVIGGIQSGSVPWVVGEDQLAGLLVDINNPDEISGALSRMLTNEEIYNEFSIQAKKRAREYFSSEKVLDEYITLYKNNAVNR